MKRKLNCILLIDDDLPTNFLHEIVIDKSGCTEKVVTRQSGKEALEYLRSTENGSHPQPDLIFLDINMPGMNGWEFLSEYEKLRAVEKGRIVLVMLTTSLNPDDKENAKSNSDIKGFRNKPLTEEIIQEILEEYFADWM